MDIPRPHPPGQETATHETATSGHRESVRFLLTIQGLPDVGRDELAALTVELRGRLLDVPDVAAVERIDDPNVTPGGKDATAFVPGSLAVVTVGSFVLRQVFLTIRSWLEHRPVVNVKLRDGEVETEITGSSADVDLALDRLLAHHERRAGGGSGD